MYSSTSPADTKSRVKWLERNLLLEEFRCSKWISFEMVDGGKLLTIRPPRSVTEIVPIAGEPNGLADGIPPTPNCIIFPPGTAKLTVTLELAQNTNTL